MIAKYCAALSFTATWGVIVLGIFRGLPLAVWFIVLALAFLGAMAAYNSMIATAARPASQPCNGECNKASDTVALKAGPPQKL